MKKILAVVLGAILLCTGVFALSACGNDKPEGGTQVSVYAPDGAPALALAQLMSEDMQFGGTVTYNVVAADTIQTYVTGNAPKADIAVLPVNAAAMLLGKGDAYQMLGAVTHGNDRALWSRGRVDAVSRSGRPRHGSSRGSNLACRVPDGRGIPIARGE